MSDYTTNATVNLQMNGKEPKEVLSDLKNRAFDLQNAIAKAASEGKKYELNRLRKELKTTNRQIREMESATEQVTEVMKRLDRATPKELQQSLRTLEKQLNSIERGTAEWEEQCKQIKAVKAEINKVNSELREGEGFWDRFNRKMNDWQTTIAAGAAAVAGVVMAGRGAVNAYASMDAEMAGVRKYTGMEAEQVKTLNEEFKKIDTRTSREELNKLAQEAGRLGKTSQEDVLGFVKAADKINVALDDLGDGATLILSKLTSIFGDEKKLGTEKAMLAVGSVINELSQNCTASAPYLAQFAQRLAGVGAQAEMTIPQIMAYAAVLDSQGQAVEMSATALSTLVMNLFKDTDRIAQATGMDLEKFKETLNKSTNEGLLMLLQRLHELGGMDVLAPVFSDMGEEGARASAVISALAANIDMVKWEQEEANKAFKEATSVTKEFNVQNTTVEAELEKAKKGVTEMSVELGEKLKPVMSHVISSSTMLLKAMSIIISFLEQHMGKIVALTAAIVAYNVVLNASNILFKIQYGWLVLVNGAHKVGAALHATYRTAVLMTTVAVNKFTKNTERAAAAQRMLNKAQKANLYALLAALIAAAVVAIYNYITAEDKLTAEEKKRSAIQGEMAEIRKKAAKSAADEMVEINLLVDAARNEKLAMEERRKAVEKLNSIIPGYNGQLDETTGKYNDNKEALDKYNAALLRKYELEGAKDQLKAVGERLAGYAIDKATAEKEYKEMQEKAKKAKSNTSRPNAKGHGRSAADVDMGYIYATADQAWDTAVEKAKQKVDDIQAQIDIQKGLADTIQSVYGEDLQKAAANGTTVTTTTVTPPGGDTESKDKFAAEKEWKAQQEALNRIAYAKGEVDYETYTKVMNEITLQFHKKQLAHTDLSATERLQIEADFYEAQKKIQEDALSSSKEEELQRYNAAVATEKQRYIDGEISLELYNDATERLELEHLQRMTQIFKKGSAEYETAFRQYQDKLLADQKKKQSEAEQAEKKYQETLDSFKKKYFGNNKAENEQLLQKDLEMLEVVYNAELVAAGNNAAERLRIEEAYEKAKLAIRTKYSEMGSENEMNLMQQWVSNSMEWLQSDGGQAVVGTFDTLVSGMGAIFSGLSSLVQTELEVQTAALEQRYDKEISMAEGNTYKVKKLEKQKAAEMAKLKNEANKKIFAMQVIQAVAQTAQNALAAYGSAASIPVVGYILAPVAAAMAVAAGAIQIATIKKQQQAAEAQGFMLGGFTKKGKRDEVAGVVHAGEWVASQTLVNHPAARPLINALDYAQRTNTIGSLRSEDVSRSIVAPMVTAQSSTQSVSAPQTVYVEAPSRDDDGFKDVVRKLAQRLNEPFVTVNTVTGDQGIQKAQDEYEQLIKNKTPKSKR